MLRSIIFDQGGRIYVRNNYRYFIGFVVDRFGNR